jgi:lipoprotein-anchoring transpeptidase ErfK/SrfK
MRPGTFVSFLVCAAALLATVETGRGGTLSADAVNNATFGPVSKNRTSALVIKAEVLLDRAGFSPGVIDGRTGDNFKKALVAFQRQNGLADSGNLDAQTFDRLTATSSDPVLRDYEITRADVDAHYVHKIPKRFEAMARLPHLSYTGPRQALAERFHMSQRLIEELNSRASFRRPGTRLTVANVEDRHRNGAVSKIVVDKQDRSVSAFDRDGHLLGFYPASIGSEEKPAPSGTFKVRRVAKNPTYHYDPKFRFRGVKAKHKITIKPGPNNPVGVVWIDLTAPSYGIHGTPNPDNIGKTESHGCIRLTNWDALALAAMVKRGTEVDFVGNSGSAQASGAASGGAGPSGHAN